MSAIMTRSPFRALACALGLAGCSTNQAAMPTMQVGFPGARAAATLGFLAERGEYLDVVVKSGGSRYRFFLPNDEACRSLFAGERAVTYATAGIFGRLQTSEAICDPIGILSLPEWRNRRPRRQTAAVIPRDQVQLHQRVYADAEVTLIRGRFRLAVQVGLTGGEDMIAVVPFASECEDLAIPGIASMEFRPAGPRVFTLINGRRLCPVIGFVVPDSSPAP